MDYFATVKMEKGLKFVLMPSLKEMALRRIAIALYNEPSVLASIANLQFKTDRMVWDVMGNIWDYDRMLEYDEMMYDFPKMHWHKTLEYKFSQLLLPKSLKNKLMPILKAVGSEIFKWKFIHEEYLTDLNEYSRVHVFKTLCWNSAGSVHYRKTAEELVRSDVIDIMKRFELACFYCLEDYIPLLWSELPGESKETFCKSRVGTPHLELFLPYIIKKNQSKLQFLVIEPRYRNSFEESALYGNKTLAEFFFQKLTKEERGACLVRTAKEVIGVIEEIDSRRYYHHYSLEDEKLAGVLRYLLSVMIPEEQLQILKDLPCEVLTCFLIWPWQDLFLDIADVVWTFLPESKYGDFMVKILENIFKGGHHFPDIFQNLFVRSPREFRKRFLVENRGRGFIWDLFHANDTETIKVILKNIDAVDRVRLVCSYDILSLIYRRPKRWHLLESCLREAMLSKEEKERLKEAFVEFARTEEASMEWLREEHGKFFEFVEEREIVLKARSARKRMLSVE